MQKGELAERSQTAAAEISRLTADGVKTADGAGQLLAKLVPDIQKTAELVREILQERVVSSRNRINFHGVKRKMSNYNLRPRKRQRTRRIDVSKRIRIVK